MITHRTPESRGHIKNDWIESFRTFSNNSYYDPNYIHFSDLEVINDDTVQPKNFVPIHQHCDMEIIGYVIKGPCYHNDNLRNIVHVPSGGVQRMSTGTGIWHTEGNLSEEPIRYLQIWMRPKIHNTPPEYTAWEFTREEKLNDWCLIASDKGPVYIKSDVKLFAAIFTKDFECALSPNRRYYMYVINGKATINGIQVTQGSGLSFVNENKLTLENPEDEPEILLFNLR
jgi:redox-sensitive bicupin YhaK (pirin superfamily)